MFFVASDLKISVERLLNKKTGHVDCKFSMPGHKPIHVEVKNSNNPAGIKKIYEKTVDKYAGSSSLCAFFVVMDFSKNGSVQLHDTKTIENACCKIIGIDVSFKHESGDTAMDWVGTTFIDFDGMKLDDIYFNERSKAGASSYQCNKPLQKIVKNLCNKLLMNKKYSSASLLCNDVSKIVEEKHMDLLIKFSPYIKAKKSGKDWREPTFYRWCKAIYKSEATVAEWSDEI